MRNYTMKTFYKTYKYKRWFKEPVEYKVFVAGYHRSYLKHRIELDNKILKKGIQGCNEEFERMNRCDAAGANQTYIGNIFICVHWEEKEIILLYKDDK